MCKIAMEKDLIEVVRVLSTDGVFSATVHAVDQDCVTLVTKGGIKLALPHNGENLPSPGDVVKLAEDGQLVLVTEVAEVQQVTEQVKPVKKTRSAGCSPEILRELIQ